ncbi:MAG TPA: carbohydrate kinase family protein [Hyphomicrobiaceae bacterium]|nr:carbohydrate kinase family protein [Hyphomicrobiaceae bacterium]
MKALTVGSAMIDTIAIIASESIEHMSMRNADSSFLLLEEGSKTDAIEISAHCGGGAINTAVAMSRLGLDVATLIKLGRDSRAEVILARLMEEKVSTRWALRDERAPTGASVLVSSHDRNAAVFTFRGANTLLEPSDLRDEAFAVDLCYISNLSNRSAECFPLLVRQAKAQGALVAANPGVRQLSARGGALLESLRGIDILTINRREACVLVPGLVARFGEGGPPLPTEDGERLTALASRGLSGGGFQMRLTAFFLALAELGARFVLVTDGSSGAFLGMGNEILFCPAAHAEIAGTAGAGDAFAATFSCFLAAGQPPDIALRAATINAASVVAHVDTQTGLLRKDEMEARLAQRSAELKIRQWRLGA